MSVVLLDWIFNETEPRVRDYHFAIRGNIGGEIQMAGWHHGQRNLAEYMGQMKDWLNVSVGCENKSLQC